MNYNVRLWSVVIAEGLMVFGYSISFPFLALYLTMERNINMSITGIYFSAVMIISSLSSTLGGILSDHIGRKKVMFYSLLSRSFFVIIIAVSIKYNLHPIWILFFNFLASVLGLGFHPVAIAYISDIVDEKDRVKAYSILRVSTNAGWASGPAIGGLLSNISYSLAFFTSGLIIFISSLIIFLKVDEKLTKSYNNKEKTSIKIALMSKTFKKLIIFSFLITAVMAQLVVPLSLYSKKYLGFSEKNIGVLFTINGLIVVFFQYIVGSKIKQEKLISAISISCIIYGIGYLLFGYSKYYTLAIIAIIIVTCGEIILSPSLSALVTEFSPHSKRGSYIGIHSMFSEFGRAFGVFIGTTMIDKFSTRFNQMPWYFIFIISLISSYGFYTLKHSKKNMKIKTPSSTIPEGVLK